MFNKAAGEVVYEFEWDVRSRVYLEKCRRLEKCVELKDLVIVDSNRK